jgi:hypothetical protein
MISCNTEPPRSSPAEARRERYEASRGTRSRPWPPVSLTGRHDAPSSYDTSSRRPPMVPLSGAPFTYSASIPTGTGVPPRTSPARSVSTSKARLIVEGQVDQGQEGPSVVGRGGRPERPLGVPLGRQLPAAGVERRVRDDLVRVLVDGGVPHVPEPLPRLAVRAQKPGGRRPGAGPCRPGAPGSPPTTRRLAWSGRPRALHSGAGPPGSASPRSPSKTSTSPTGRPARSSAARSASGSSSTASPPARPRPGWSASRTQGLVGGRGACVAGATQPLT